MSHPAPIKDSSLITLLSTGSQVKIVSLVSIL